MKISSFDDLVQAAQSQRNPQRLLFVFAGVELPDGSSPQQRADFDAGEGGALVPLMCVDKSPAELASFQALKQESLELGQDWRIVFAAALSGSRNRALTGTDARVPLERMAQDIRRGRHESFIAFDRQGQPVLFQAARM